jgi:hypothetical protein
MAGNGSATLEGRLDRLERENRRLKRLLGAGLGALVIVSLTGPAAARALAPPAAQIEAQRFVVRDAAGRVRATLGLDAGAARLVLMDGDGSITVELGGETRRFPIER